MSVQVVKALHGGYHGLGVAAFPVLGVNAPGHHSAACLAFYGCVHRAVGGPDHSGGRYSGGGKGVVRSGQILENGVFLHLTQVSVGVRMAGHLASHLIRPQNGFRVPGYVSSHLKKGGESVVGLQDVEERIGVGFMGAVIKRQRHHGLAGVDDPDIGFLRNLFRWNLFLVHLRAHGVSRNLFFCFRVALFPFRLDGDVLLR